ncbi:MAG: ribosome silencing factor [Bacteroidales bacterium]|jgi:ribosome-associated protein|nr:ribosome silencing factor [Bacteroidales bacterium]MCU0410554.1 ribosome silencing factor [Bacteroidales bacterium]
MRKTDKEATLVRDSVVKGLFEKKGEKVALIDLRKIENRVCDYFIISHATSSKQVDSLAWSVEDIVRRETGRKPYHIEGRENCIWVLLDYGDILVHIFQQPYREFYNLESLWADGTLTMLEDKVVKKGV